MFASNHNAAFINKLKQFGKASIVITGMGKVSSHSVETEGKRRAIVAKKRWNR